MPMKILDRKLRKKRTLVFVDLEGTGFSHEMIEIGAYLATLNEDGTIKRSAPLSSVMSWLIIQSAISSRT